MTAILIIIGICVFVIFRNNWKKALYLLIFMLPFFGYISLHLFHLTRFAPLVQDITLIIPIYLLFILNKINENNSQLNLPSGLNNYLLFFIFLILIFSINPFFDVSLLKRLVGIKVWIFYLLFIVIGFEFIDSETEFKKFCNFFAIITIIPCVIGILQYLGSYFINYQQTMIWFFGGNEFMAKSSTQNYAMFVWGNGVTVFRIPSTFSFPSQFGLFVRIAFVPVITALVLAKRIKEKYLYSTILVLLFVGGAASGTRSMFLFYTLFFVFLVLIRTKFYILLFMLAFVSVIISFIDLSTYIPDYFQTIYSNVVSLSISYGGGYVFQDLGYILSNSLLGNGVGSATHEARYVGEWSPIISDVTGKLLMQHEGFYHKTILELGIFGLIAIFAFFIFIIYEIVLSIRFISDNKASLFCSLLLAFFLTMIIESSKGAFVFTKYPGNFFFYFLLGIAIKLRFINFDKETIT